MPFTKTYLAPNGASLEFHKITRVEAGADLQTFHVDVASWHTEADYIAGKSPVWVSPETRPLDGSILTALQDAVLASGDFLGATPVADATETLEAAKARLWAQMKIKREADKSKPLVTPYGTFDAAKDDRDNLADEHALRRLCGDRGYPTNGEFTRYDNSVIDLTFEQIGDVCLLLGQQVKAAYERGRVVRNAIEAATSYEDLNLITWEE